jgi:hypothetical protein
LKEPSPDGPTISALEFVPARTTEGCPVVLRFHFDSAGGERGVRAWTLMDTMAGSGRAQRIAASGSLGGRTSGEATVRLSFPYPGTYRYSVQVQDEAGGWSNILNAGIVIGQRLRNIVPTCQ